MTSEIPGRPNNLTEMKNTSNPQKMVDGGALEIKTNYQSMNTYILGAIIFGLVVTLLWYSYSCFCENQNLITEPFIVKPIKTGIDDDLVFDVDGEVNKLRRLQEKYLVTLNAKRNR
jgi:hypothetical protein